MIGADKADERQEHADSKVDAIDEDADPGDARHGRDDRWRHRVGGGIRHAEAVQHPRGVEGRRIETRVRQEPDIVREPGLASLLGDARHGRGEAVGDACGRPDKAGKPDAVGLGDDEIEVVGVKFAVFVEPFEGDLLAQLGDLEVREKAEGPAELEMTLDLEDPAGAGSNGGSGQ